MIPQALYIEYARLSVHKKKINTLLLVLKEIFESGFASFYIHGSTMTHLEIELESESSLQFFYKREKLYI